VAPRPRNVLDAIRTAILAGELAAGETLRHVDLVERLRLGEEGEGEGFGEKCTPHPHPASS
jgi:hypothetical protein